MSIYEECDFFTTDKVEQYQMIYSILHRLFNKTNRSIRGEHFVSGKYLKCTEIYMMTAQAFQHFLPVVQLFPSHSKLEKWLRTRLRPVLKKSASNAI